MKKGLLTGLAAICAAYAGMGATDISRFNSDTMRFEIDTTHGAAIIGGTLCAAIGAYALSKIAPSIIENSKSIKSIATRVAKQATGIIMESLGYKTQIHKTNPYFSPSNLKSALQLAGVLTVGLTVTEIASGWNYKFTPPIKPIAILKRTINIPQHIRDVQEIGSLIVNFTNPDYCLRAKNMFFLRKLWTGRTGELHPFPKQLEDHIAQYHSETKESDEQKIKRRESWLGFEEGVSRKECLSERGLFSDPNTGRCTAQVYDRQHAHSDDVGIDRTDRWSVGCFLIDDVVARTICASEKSPKTTLVTFSFKGYKRLVSNSGRHYVYAKELRLQTNEPDQAPREIFGTPLKDIYFMWDNSYALDGLFGKRPGESEPSEETYKVGKETRQYYQQRTDIDSPIKLKFYRVDPKGNVKLCERDFSGNENQTAISPSYLSRETLEFWKECKEKVMREK